MANKVKVVVTHEEIAEVDLGDVSPQFFGDLLKNGLDNSNWSVADLPNSDWRRIKIEVDGKEIV